MNHRILTAIGSAVVLIACFSSVHAMPASYVWPGVTSFELKQNDLGKFEVADYGWKVPVVEDAIGHPWDYTFENDTFLKTDDTPRMALSSAYARGRQGSSSQQFAVSGNIADATAYSDGGTRTVLVNPEPATLILLGAGLVGAGLTARRRRRVH